MQVIQWVMARLNEYVNFLLVTPTPLQVTGLFTITWGGLLIWFTIMTASVNFFMRMLDIQTSNIAEYIHYKKR